MRLDTADSRPMLWLKSNSTRMSCLRITAISRLTITIARMLNNRRTFNSDRMLYRCNFYN